MGLFRRKRRQSQPELVELPVGYDRTFASIIAARCEAENIPVQLLTMDNHGLVPGPALLGEHRLLIRASDRERVEQIARRR